jgi:hypothetical protein
MKLTWSRTVIRGRTAPYDFAAFDAGKHVGRIYRHDTSQLGRGGSFWAMNASGPGINRSGVNIGLAFGTVGKTGATAVAWYAYGPCLIFAGYAACLEPENGDMPSDARIASVLF